VSGPARRDGARRAGLRIDERDDARRQGSPSGRGQRGSGRQARKSSRRPSHRKARAAYGAAIAPDLGLADTGRLTGSRARSRFDPPVVPADRQRRPTRAASRRVRVRPGAATFASLPPIPRCPRLTEEPCRLAYPGSSIRSPARRAAVSSGWPRTRTARPSGRPSALFLKEGQEHLAELDDRGPRAERRTEVSVRDCWRPLVAAAARRAGVRSSPRPNRVHCDEFLAARGFRPVLVLTYAAVAGRRGSHGDRRTGRTPARGYRLTEWNGHGARRTGPLVRRGRAAPWTTCRWRNRLRHRRVDVQRLIARPRRSHGAGPCCTPSPRWTRRTACRRVLRTGRTGRRTRRRTATTARPYCHAHRGHGSPLDEGRFDPPGA